MALSSQAWNDAGGVAHTPAERGSYRRIVSLVPSLTETLCAVGGRPKLVGCTAFCILPAGLLKDPAITIVGGTKTVLREKLLALKPDLLLLNLEENTLEDIDFFKPRVKCYINGVRTLEQGIDSIEELGALLGDEALAAPLAEKARAILASIRARAGARTAAGGRPPRLFYPVWRDPWMSINADTFIHDLIATCGAENICAARNSSRYPVVTLEEVRRAAPEIVWLPSEPYAFEEKHKAEFERLMGWPDAPPASARPVPASARNCRIELVNGENACWFGVRQIEGMEYAFIRLWGQAPDAGPLPVS